LGYYSFPSCAGGDGFDVLRKSLSQDEANQKRIVLPEFQVAPGEVILLIEGAPPQIYGVDYMVVGNELIWGGMGLDGQLATGDEITVVHQ